MKLSLKKYRQIVKFKKFLNFNDFDLITNYGLFSGDNNLFKTLQIFKLVLMAKSVRGDIIELGVHNGNTSLLIKKILDIFHINKKLFLLDHFKGLITYQKKDTKASIKFFGKYKGYQKNITKFLNFFNFKNVKFIKVDATKIGNNFFKNKVFSLAYFDMDLYLPTIKALEAIKKNINIGGIIVFDQGYKKLFAEKKAINEFIKKNKNFKKIIIDKKRQPDVILKKIRH